MSARDLYFDIIVMSLSTEYPGLIQIFVKFVALEIATYEVPCFLLVLHKST